jgi:uncharacterized sulfatase
MRDGDWKLLCDYDGSRPELYNLVTDSGEEINLALTNPKQTERMVGQTLNWWKAIQTPLRSH